MSEAKNEELLFEAPDNDQSNSMDVSVESGKEFSIKIRGNPTTGYGWYLKNAEAISNSAVLKAKNLNEYESTNDYKTDPHAAGMVGVPGSYYFTFEATASAGKKEALTFVYKRPWEKETEPIYTLTVNVSII
jgi:predicted secreted protein